MGRPANNRRFSNVVFWVLRAGPSWLDLPPDYGHGASTYNRFRNWQKDCAWENLLATLTNDPDLEWMVIGGSYVKVISTAQGQQGGQSGSGRAKGGRLPNSIRPWTPTECRFGCWPQRERWPIVPKQRR